MKLTAEQRFLNTLAGYFKNRTKTMTDVSQEDANIMYASEKYLASQDLFTDASKMVESEPSWTPEVGKLYQNKFNGVVTEIVKIFKDNHEKTKIAHKLMDFDYNCCDAHCDYEEDFVKAYEPIAELEGLDVEDKVWCISSDGETEYYTIESVFSNNMGVYCGKGYISLNLNGSPCMFGNGKQLFYRTEDRAERFGKGGDA